LLTHFVKPICFEGESAPLFLQLLMTSFHVSAQTETPLVHQPPNGINYSMLMTDGTVMAQDLLYLNQWWRLTPDINGSYANGAWTQMASLPASYSPLASASAVLADGRVIVLGGEYSGPSEAFTLTNQGAIYDPRSDTWTPLAPPPGVANIGDSPSVVLPDGLYLFGDKLTKRLHALDPHTLKWTDLESEGKNDFNSEEGWTLLPDGEVLTLDVKSAPRAEIYSPREHEWRPVRDVPIDLHSPTPVVGCIPYGPSPSQCYYPPGEIGPALLRPDGTVFATGSYANNDPNFGTGSAAHTAIFDTDTRTWAVGPDFPNNDNVGDAPAVLLPNGHVVMQGYFDVYEFDGRQILSTHSPYYLAPTTVLPTGEALGTGSYPTSVYPVVLYTSPGDHDRAWEPVIARVEADHLVPGATYRIWGQQFNGLSQAQAFGDEFQAAQNYPLVRITNKKSGHVFYARTHDHSTMGVATGRMLVWTNFDVPVHVESGASKLEVVANGIASQPINVSVHSNGPSN
jgi:hypothetical protein